jgi:hypothetical protein
MRCAAQVEGRAVQKQSGSDSIDSRMLSIQKLLALVFIGLEAKMIGKNRQKIAFYSR